MRPKPDPLAALARLRRLETGQAKRLLAERLGRSAAATGRLDESEEALRRERDHAAAPRGRGQDHAGMAAAHGWPGDHAAWLPRALAERARSAAALDLARRAEDEARAVLAAARAAERAVEHLAEARAADGARRSRRAEQARLDGIVGGIR